MLYNQLKKGGLSLFLKKCIKLIMGRYVYIKDAECCLNLYVYVCTERSQY